MTRCPACHCDTASPEVRYCDLPQCPFHNPAPVAAEQDATPHSPASAIVEEDA